LFLAAFVCSTNTSAFDYPISENGLSKPRIFRGHGHGEHLTGGLQTTHFQLAKRAVRPGITEHCLDQFANDFADRVAEAPGSAFIDRAGAGGYLLFCATCGVTPILRQSSAKSASGVPASGCCSGEVICPAVNLDFFIAPLCPKRSRQSDLAILSTHADGTTSQANCLRSKVSANPG